MIDKAIDFLRRNVKFLRSCNVFLNLLLTVRRMQNSEIRMDADWPFWILIPRGSAIW
jgi:hypothetical protein